MSAIGYRCAAVFDPSKPELTPRKLLDVTRLSSVCWLLKVSLKTIETKCDRFSGNVFDAHDSAALALSTRVRIARSFQSRCKPFNHSVLFQLVRYTVCEGVNVVVEADVKSKMRFFDETAKGAVSRRFDWIPSWS
jgi:hypothetical protein